MKRKATIDQVKEKHEATLLGIDGVEGVGIGDDQGSPVIKVYVSRDPKFLKHVIPDQIEGHLVRLEYSGKFKTLD